MGDYGKGDTVIYNSASITLDPVSGYHYVQTPTDMWVAKEFLVDVVTTPAPTTEVMYATADGLRVRSAPSLTATVLRMVNKDTAFTVETVEVDGSGIKWRKLANQTAYVARAYLTFTAPGAGTTTNPKVQQATAST